MDNSKLLIYMTAQTSKKKAISKLLLYMATKSKFKARPNNFSLHKKFSFYKIMINKIYTIRVNSINRIKSLKHLNFTLKNNNNSRLHPNFIQAISRNFKASNCTIINRLLLLNTRAVSKNNRTKRRLFILKACKTFNNNKSSQDIKPLNFMIKINNLFKRSNLNSRLLHFTRTLTGSLSHSKSLISSSSSKILTISKGLINISPIVKLKIITKQYNKIKWIILNLERKFQNKLIIRIIKTLISENNRDYETESVILTKM